jgi:hypothetical protein
MTKATKKFRVNTFSTRWVLQRIRELVGTKNLPIAVVTRENDYEDVRTITGLEITEVVGGDTVLVLLADKDRGVKTHCSLPDGDGQPEGLFRAEDQEVIREDDAKTALDWSDANFGMDLYRIFESESEGDTVWLRGYFRDTATKLQPPHNLRPRRKK